MFGLLRQSADPEAVDAIERLVAEAPDHKLVRINALAFAAQHGLDEERVIAAFLHAAKIGIFDLSWNVLCPGCGGVLDSGSNAEDGAQRGLFLLAVRHRLRADARRDGGGDLHGQPARAPDCRAQSGTSCCRWNISASSISARSSTCPRISMRSSRRSRWNPSTFRPGEKAILSLQLPAEFIIVFEPVTHTAQFIDVKGEPTKERQALTLIFDNDSSAASDRRDAARAAPASRSRIAPTCGSCRASSSPGTTLHDLMKQRRPFLTAKRLLSNQTFRDIYRTDTLDVDQRLKITSLTFLFTDLRGSTELYERVGDLVAFDLVRAHFKVLNEIVASEAGAVVKTIGDAVMATFPTPDRAIAAALRMRDAMRTLNEGREREDLILKIGIHVGPCIAVTLNERQDYFGQTVNIASRVQGLATSREIFATGAVVEDALASGVLAAGGITPMSHNATLKGIANEVAVYAIP